MTKGNFVISLDFEINWGVWDVFDFNSYKNNLLGVRHVIPRMLDLFKKYEINATFATVGFLFFNDKEELIAGLPERKPQYSNPHISPYISQLQKIGRNEKEDLYHFAPSLIELIKHSGQEIGCHTFSHYYCLEKGQTIDDFKEDLKAARKIAEKRNISITSFVFPRNQYNESYLKACKEQGILSYRGNEKSWLFTSNNFGKSTLYRRPFRLLDAYINLSGHNCYSEEYMKSSDPINIPGSRFLRPFSPRLAFLENMRLKRITESMVYAAKNGLTYHLWWHPHNFGINIDKNFSFLENILKHFTLLSRQYDFKSVSMGQLAIALKSQP